MIRQILLPTWAGSRSSRSRKPTNRSSGRSQLEKKRDRTRDDTPARISPRDFSSELTTSASTVSGSRTSKPKSTRIKFTENTITETPTPTEDQNTNDKSEDLKLANRDKEDSNNYQSLSKDLQMRITQIQQLEKDNQALKQEVEDYQVKLEEKNHHLEKVISDYRCVQIKLNDKELIFKKLDDENSSLRNLLKQKDAEIALKGVEYKKILNEVQYLQKEKKIVRYILMFFAVLILSLLITQWVNDILQIPVEKHSLLIPVLCDKHFDEHDPTSKFFIKKDNLLNQLRTNPTFMKHGISFVKVHSTAEIYPSSLFLYVIRMSTPELQEISKFGKLKAQTNAHMIIVGLQEIGSSPPELPPLHQNSISGFDNDTFDPFILSLHAHDQKIPLNKYNGKLIEEFIDRLKSKSLLKIEKEL